jgi:hypothetical protein
VASDEDLRHVDGIGSLRLQLPVGEEPLDVHGNGARMMDVPTPARPKPTRRAVAFVVAIDLAIATGVGFGVYFATRRFGPPTPPRNVEATAAVCVPEECSEVSATVSLSWAPPVVR